MTDYIIDTNVPIVANGRHQGNVKVDCRLAAVKLLVEATTSGRIFVDEGGEVQAEYRTYMNPSGQPGVGDRFFQQVLLCAPNVTRVPLPRDGNGDFADLPEAVKASTFDKSDRKFAALSAKTSADVYNATDSDWVEHKALLESAGIGVVFVCGCDTSGWFEPS